MRIHAGSWSLTAAIYLRPPSQPTVLQFSVATYGPTRRRVLAFSGSTGNSFTRGGKKEPPGYLRTATGIAHCESVSRDLRPTGHKRGAPLFSSDRKPFSSGSIREGTLEVEMIERQRNEMNFVLSRNV